MIASVADDGKDREMFCLSLKCVPKWLSEINVAKVKPETREKLRVYQAECRDVLAAHFGLLGDGEAPRPRFRLPLRAFLATGKNAQNSLIRVHGSNLDLVEELVSAPGVVVSEVDVRMVVQDEVRKLMPVTRPPAGKWLTATQLGGSLSTAKSPVDTNVLLERAGLQRRVAGQWRLTVAGQRYGRERSGTDGTREWRSCVWKASTSQVLEQLLSQAPLF